MGKIVSGVQPSGNLHLGNYLGAIRQWVKLQHEHECLFFLADMHSITVPQSPDSLRKSVRETAAAYIASGIDPEKNIIFVQSMVSGHADLAWILGCNTPIGWLNRMTQFKEKAGKDKEKASLGLYSYPVLMAADILLYKATIVPTGEDQKQHIELTRDIAGAFNRNYEVEFFPLPEPMIMGDATRVMSLRDGTKKMSKSDPSEFSRINLIDDKDAIFDKIKRAKTDAISGVTYEPETRPEVANLINIFASLSDKAAKDIATQYENSGFADFKKDLAELTADKIGNISAEMKKLLSDTAYLDAILKKGAEKAQEQADKTIQEIKTLVGF